MVNVTRRKDSPYWWLSYQDGKRVRVSTCIHHNNLKQPPKDSLVWEITRKIEDRLARKRFGLAATVEAKPIAEFFSEYIGGMLGKVDGTITRYRTIASQIDEWAKARQIHTIADIDYGKAVQYVTQLKESKSVNTIVVEVGFLRGAWEEAKRRNYCDFQENPWAIKVKKEKVEKSKFTQGEVQKLLALNWPSWMRTCVMIGLYTGARVGSIKALCWEHVGIDMGVINFVKSKTSSYSVPIHPALGEYLRSICQSTGHVLPAEVLSKSPAYVSKVFSEFLAEHGFEGTFHKFRHTFISRLTECGVDKRVSMLLANHTSEAVHNNYTHADALAAAPSLSKLNY